MHFGRNRPRLTQLVECLTVVGKYASLADIRMSPVQVRERGPINGSEYVKNNSIIGLIWRRYGILA